MSSSNQVYRGSTPQTPNVYVSDLIAGAVGGGAVVTSPMYLSAPPTVVTAAYDYLVYNSVSGEVEARTAASTPFNGFTVQNSTVTQPVNSGGDSIVLFPNTVQVDSTLSYNNTFGTWTASQPGQYTVAYTIAWDAIGASVSGTWLNTSASGFQRIGEVSQLGTSVANMPLSSGAVLSLGAGASFAVHVTQASGAPVNLIGTAVNGITFCQIRIARISPTGTA